jgi:hypothetical protein
MLTYASAAEGGVGGGLTGVSRGRSEGGVSARGQLPSEQYSDSPWATRHTRGTAFREPTSAATSAATSVLRQDGVVAQGAAKGAEVGGGGGGAASARGGDGRWGAGGGVGGGGHALGGARSDLAAASLGGVYGSVFVQQRSAALSRARAALLGALEVAGQPPAHNESTDARRDGAEDGHRSVAAEGTLI